MANLSQKKRKKMLDFLKTLKQQHSDDESLMAINEIEKELTAKKYGLVWEEHEEEVDVKMQTHIPVFTEDKEKEIVGNPESDEYDFLLEGDNLHSLKLLEKTHKGKIDVIYIDPPYNTGGKDFEYNDKLVVYEDTFRHSKWLSFMEKRLKMAKKLLSKQGMIFISIDDNEHSQLKILCDSIFGEQNYVTSLIWQKKKGGGNDSRYVATEHEYILFYTYNKDDLDKIFIPYGDEYITRYKETDEKGRFFWDTFKRKSGKQYYAITCPDGTILENDENGEPISWLRSEKRFLSDLQEGEVRIIKVNGKWTVHFKQRQPKGYKPRSIMTDYGTTSDGAAELKRVFNITNVFSNPKPVSLVKYLIKFSSNKNALVLDFFAGSGTTGQAVLELNQEDGGNRKFILCTNNENNICEEVTYQRLKTVITGLRADTSQYSDGLPSNLKYYKTDFISKDSEELYDDLLDHTVEMIQLQYGVKVDNEKYVIIMDDDEMDEFEKNFQKYTELKALFINQDVLLTTAQEKLLSNVNTFIIPDCYFDFELREAGELW
ncbi:MAG: site-specific DNA-methyltransferase [Clostridiales bacterium]|nr:site-specific DNA-methyltransferase [Clostridiales bacterium]